MLAFSYTPHPPVDAAPSRLLGSLCLGSAAEAGPAGHAAPRLQLPLRNLAAHAPCWQAWQARGTVRVAEPSEVDGVSLALAETDEFLFVTAQANPRLPVEAQSRSTYLALLQRLRAHGKPHPLRIWNYLPHINLHEHGVERYRAFNSGRHQAFSELGYSLADGAPAACTVGSHQGSLQIAVLSGRRPPVAIENPRQVSAYHYPQRYGLHPPLFSRAALYPQPGGADLLLISGTASIVGHESLHAGDVVAQTLEALRNLEALLAAATPPAGGPSWRLHDLDGRVYLRHADDLAAVQACLAARSMHRFSYAEADICRSELRVEIEAEGLAGPRPRA